MKRLIEVRMLERCDILRSRLSEAWRARLRACAELAN